MIRMPKHLLEDALRSDRFAGERQRFC